MTIQFASRGAARISCRDGYVRITLRIAELKAPDLNSNDVEAAMRMVMGTARSMGIEVKG